MKVNMGGRPLTGTMKLGAMYRRKMKTEQRRWERQMSRFRERERVRKINETLTIKPSTHKVKLDVK